ncbi:MAG: lasso peptide biosynthesis B2 protein [Candidatus Hydrogenedentota bacterium]|nr:MAG: lasso peptide biosynthesis B2 protein [Candidatus Hydrogenedentota bacterium]
MRLRIHLQTILLLLRTFSLLRRNPVEAFQAVLCPVTNVPSEQRLPLSEIVEAVDTILLFRIAGKLLFRTRCLKRSLILYWILRNEGYSAEVQLGFLRDTSVEDSLRGHAWITVDGNPIPDPWPEVQQLPFVPFYKINESILPLTDV